MTEKLISALKAIIERSNNGELGTSKVIDMRRIAEEALTATEESSADLAKVLFLTDWPNDKWERFGPDDHARNRYVRMANAADSYFSDKDNTLRNGPGCGIEVAGYVNAQALKEGWGLITKDLGGVVSSGGEHANTDTAVYIVPDTVPPADGHSPATDAQIAHMKRFWREAPQVPSMRMMNSHLLRNDFLSLIARIKDDKNV